MCRNVLERSVKINMILLPLKYAKWRQKAIDVHACMVISKSYDVTNVQTKKTRAHFSHVSFSEI